MISVDLESGIHRKVIDVCFRRIPVELVLGSLSPESEIPISLRHTLFNPNQKIIATYLLHHSHGLSGDECAQQAAIAFAKLKAEERGTPINWIKDFADICFSATTSAQPLIVFDNYLRWRNLSFLLTEDLFSCAKRPSSNLLDDLLWPQVLLSDSDKLNSLVFSKEEDNKTVDRKLVDNHVHLNAAGPVFMPAWIVLMNHPELIATALQEAKMDVEKLSPSIQVVPNLAQLSMSEKLWIAALIRVKLVAICIDNRDTFSERWLSALQHPASLVSYQHDVSEEIRNVRGIVQLRNANIACEPLDYAWDMIELSSQSTIPRLVEILSIGERALMTKMMEAILDGDSNSPLKKYGDLFYAYLLIKHRFRGELNLINDKVGFANFVQYESRKDKIAELIPTVGKVRMGYAIRGALQNEGLDKTDLRFNPGGKRTSAGDLNIYLHERIEEIRKDYLNKEQPEEIDLLPRLSFVGHFIKRGYSMEGHPADQNLRPRHFSLRESIRKTAGNITEFRRDGYSMKQFLKGIDAAASEIQCRPEIFAQAFRYLRHPPSKPDPMEKYLGLDLGAPELKFKFHCGEEFLDPIDGMRYMDEAILFLKLEERDYLGHGLAMGIDLESWYASKGYRLMLKRQDYLDNVVWLLHRSIELGVDLDEGFRNELEQEYQSHFQYIYQNRAGESSLEYFKAWKLRGDDPFRYYPQEYSALEQYPDGSWEAFSELRPDQDELRIARLDKNIRMLLRLYHFDQEVKQKGFESINVKINPRMPKRLKAFQKAFRDQVFSMGLHIETLPSINVALGTFRRFDQHPIFQFLPPSPDFFPKLKPVVSIGTDNPGLMNTNVKAEFTMIACACIKSFRAGIKMGFQSEEEIYSWLGKIADLGNDHF